MKLATSFHQHFRSNKIQNPSGWNFGRMNFSSSSALFNKCLVFAEHNKTDILPTTLSAITAASKISDDINVLIIGNDVSELAKKAAQIKGVKKVFFKNSETFNHLLPEKVSPLLSDIQHKHNFSHIISTTTSNGKNILPRFAATFDVAPISDVLKIVSEDTFVRPIYAGNALSVIKSIDKLKVMTVRATGFDKAEATGGNAEISEVDYEVPKESAEDTTKYVSSDVSKDKKVELTDASVVVSGGRGLKNGDNFKMLYELADVFNGAVGASRGAVDDGYCSNDLQVGQTGKIVAPDLYIAVGISGAIQHLAGMKDSKVIVAINKNEDAPIFQVADYGLVADLFEAVPALAQEVKNKKTQK